VLVHWNDRISRKLERVLTSYEMSSTNQDIRNMCITYNNLIDKLNKDKDLSLIYASREKLKQRLLES